MMIRDLYRSPIIKLVAAFVGGSAAVMWMLPIAVRNEAVDSFAIAGNAAVIWAYRRNFMAAVRDPVPMREDYLIGGIVFAAGAIVGLRVLRQVGIDLGIIGTAAVQETFGVLSQIMVFGAFLQISAIGKRDAYGRVSPTALRSIACAGIAGCVVWAATWMARVIRPFLF